MIQVRKDEEPGDTIAGTDAESLATQKEATATEAQSTA